MRHGFIFLALTVISGCSVWLPAPAPASHEADSNNRYTHSIGYMDAGLVRVYGSRTHLDGSKGGIDCAIERLSSIPDVHVHGIQYEIRASERWFDLNNKLDTTRASRFIDALGSIHSLFKTLGLPGIEAKIKLYLLPAGCTHDSLVLTFFATKPTYYLIFSTNSIPDITDTTVHEISHIAIRKKHGADLPGFLQETLAYAIDMLFSLRMSNASITAPDNYKVSFKCEHETVGLDFNLSNKISIAGRETAKMILHKEISGLNSMDLQQQRATKIVRELVANPTQYVCSRLSAASNKQTNSE